MGLFAEACNWVEIDFVGGRIAWIPYQSFGDNSVAVVVASMEVETLEIPC